MEYIGFVNNENESVLNTKPIATTTATKSSDVGEYPITISGGDATNYSFTYLQGILNIIKAPLTAKVNDVSQLYGQEFHNFTLTYNGLKNNEKAPTWNNSPRFHCNATKYSSVGNYIISANGEAKNYNVTFNDGILTIGKVTLTIKAKSTNRLYYETNPFFTCTYNGFVNGEDESVISVLPTLFTTATLTSKSGNYPIKVYGAQAQNYICTYEPGVLEVKKRPLQVSVGNYTRQYNEDNPEFTYSYNGFVNEEDESVLISKPTLTTIATKSSDVGTYTLFINGGVADNYDFSYINGKITIEKAYQTLSWDQDFSSIQQYSQIELTAQATSEGHITYNIEDEKICSVSNIGDKTYIDCYKTGTTVISAQQDGTNNYWPSLKVYKEINIVSSSGIVDNVNERQKHVTISINQGHITFNGITEHTEIQIYTISGSLVYRGCERSFNVPAGVYTLKIGNITTKFLVK